jgi:amino acid transporter
MKLRNNRLKERKNFYFLVTFSSFFYLFIYFLFFKGIKIKLKNTKQKNNHHKHKAQGVALFFFQKI